MTKPVVYIVIYSLYHHVYKLSLSLKEGLESKGVDVKLFQVQETLSDEILSKMHAPAKPDLPIMTVDRLSEPDGILFGLPTRFGTMPAQVKALLDASGSLWAKGALAGKFAGTFFSTASQHGGQETTALTAVTYFAHHGMMYVPFGFANAAMYSVDEVVGGSAYGCGTIANGDGSRQPTELELGIAVNQGANFGEILNTFVKGRDAGLGTTPANATTADVATTPATDNTAGAIGSSAPAGVADGVPVSSAIAGDAANSGVATDNNATTHDAATPSANTSNPTATNTGATAGAAVAGAAGTAGAIAAAISAKGKEASTTADNSVSSATGTTTNAVSSATGTATNAASSAIGTATNAVNDGVAAVSSAIPGIGNANTTNPTAAAGTAAASGAIPGVEGAITAAGTAGTTAGDTANKTASDIGAAAGNATATPNVVKESIVNKASKDNKPKKKKWFCCG